MYKELLKRRRVKKEALAWEVSFRSFLLFHLNCIYARAGRKVAADGPETCGNRDRPDSQASGMSGKTQREASDRVQQNFNFFLLPFKLNYYYNTLFISDARIFFIFLDNSF